MNRGAGVDQRLHLAPPPGWLRSGGRWPATALDGFCRTCATCVCVTLFICCCCCCCCCGFTSWNKPLWASHAFAAHETICVVSSREEHSGASLLILRVGQNKSDSLATGATCGAAVVSRPFLPRSVYFQGLQREAELNWFFSIFTSGLWLIFQQMGSEYPLSCISERWIKQAAAVSLAWEK